MSKKNGNGNGNGPNRILVVNVQEETEQDFVRRLSDLGLEIDYVADGGEAVERCRTVKYRLAIVNLKSSVPRGLYFVQLLKLRHPKLPVLAFTDPLAMSEIATALRYGVSDCLDKDAEADNLISKIRDCVN